MYNMNMESTINVLADQSEIVPFDDNLFPLYVRRHNISSYHNMKVLCHWHQEMEFIFVEKGELQYFVDGQIVGIKEGEGIFVNSACLHYGFSGNNEDATYLCLVFSPKLITPLTAISEKYVEPIKNNLDSPFVLFPKNKRKDLYNIYLEIKKINDEKKENYQILVLSKLFEFWNDFLKKNSERSSVVLIPNLKTPLVKEMLTFIYKNYSKKITVTDVANSAGLSDSYASHIFKEQIHQSIIDYINFYRLNIAMDLLKDPENTITEISYKVGFDYSSYFTELFKREKNCSPKEYRKILNK